MTQLSLIVAVPAVQDDIPSGVDVALEGLKKFLRNSLEHIVESKRLYDFGPFRLDPAERLLMRDDQPVALTPKSFDLLLILVENSGHLLGKEEILERLWPDQFVEEANLSFNISSLRKALGEGMSGQRFIETVPKKGFRFLPRVDIRETGGSAAEPAVAAPPSIAPGLPSSLKIIFGLIGVGVAVFLAYGLWASRSKPSKEQSPLTIAVLPFKSLNRENLEGLLEVGMADALITKLGSIKQLRVRPLSAVRKYTDASQNPVEVGKELRTDAVLDGSIQRDGERVRVTIRLTDVRSGIHLWSEQFNEDLSDIFKVQDTISERVVRALTLELSLEEKTRTAKHYTNDIEAYQFYLQGNYFFTKHTGDRRDNLKKSLENYKLAVEKDPTFARAYVGIAEFYISEGNPKLTPMERLVHAKAAVVKALELDDTLADAHNALAEIKYQYEFDWLGAERHFKRAIELEPNVAYFHLAISWYYMCLGQFDQAQSEFDKAQELEPDSLRINKTQGILFLFRRQFDKAISHYQRMRQLEPNLIHRNQWSMSVAYERMGMHTEAVEEFLEDGRIRAFLEPEERELLTTTFRTSGWEHYVRTRIDLLEKKSKNQYVPPATLAGMHALAGDKERALTWLEMAIETHDGWIALVKIHPAYDSLHSDPRFAQLLQKVNLTP